MYKCLILLSCIFSFSACAKTENANVPYIPVSIDAVETHRIGDNLVRVIKHNMEVSPKLELECLSTPGFNVLEQVSIKSIQLTQEKLEFEKSEGVFVEKIDIEDAAIKITFDYSFEGGGSALIQCALPVDKKGFGTLKCKKDTYR